MNSSLKHRSRCILALGMALCGLTSARASLAGPSNVIFSDHFSGANAPNDGRTPDTTDLSGATWQLTGGFFGASSVSSGILVVPGIGGTVLSTASAGAYAKPADLTISADLQVGNLNPGGNPSGIGLGFWNAVHPGGGSAADFYGLLLDSAGNLSLTSGNTVYESAPWAGPAFSTSQFYTVSYSVDTTTGGLSNLAVSGSTANYSLINNDTHGLFTAANTAYAGIRADSGNPGRNGEADNFVLSSDSSVSATPEPGTIALLISSGIVAVPFLKRRRAFRK